MKIRLTGAALVVAVLPAIAAAKTAAPILRVEGASANVIPQMAVPVAGAPTATTTIADAIDADTIKVARGSATAQVATAASWLSLPLSFDLFDFGGPSSFITQVGADRMPASFSPSWRLKVNHKVTSSGSDTTSLRANDSVLWAFVSAFEEPELDLRVATRHRAPGATLQTRVLKYDNDGVATPAAGAKVRFAGVTRTADAAGRASFPTTRSGTYWASATLKGAVRSQRELVCVHPGSEGTRCSAVSSPAQGTRIAPPHAVTGAVAGPAPGARVLVSIARLTGTRGRFLQADARTFSPARSCATRTSLAATPGAGGLWQLPIAPTSGRTLGRLAPGTYRVWSRLASGERVESRTTVGMNAVTFTVVAGGAYGA